MTRLRRDLKNFFVSCSFEFTLEEIEEFLEFYSISTNKDEVRSALLPMVNSGELCFSASRKFRRNLGYDREETHKQKGDKDYLGLSCRFCGEGTYEQTLITDDWDGVLHCTKCNKQVPRWQ